MSGRLKSRLQTCALFLGSCAFAGLLGEFLVRLVSPQPILPRYVTEAPYGIRTNIPGISYQHTSPDYRIDFRINAQGMRSDREYVVPKPPGTVRIIGLGDSFTMGYEVDLEDTYLYQLERVLHDRGHRNVEVLNLAVSGFGTAEEMLKLEHEGLAYEPDIVVLGYFNNDVENNLVSNLFRVEGDTLRRVDSSYQPAMGIRRFLESFTVYRYLAEHSHLLNLFRNYGSYYITQGLFKRKQEEYAERDSIRERDYELLLTARCIDSLARFCRVRGFPLVVLNIPTVDPGRTHLFSNIPLAFMHERQHITFVDALPIVQPALGKREIQWKWQGHWLPWVHHDAGRLLADSIETLLVSREHLTKGIGVFE
jgi:hypothetical protein